MLTDKELKKLIDHLESENLTMGMDIVKAAGRMPYMKALFDIAIAENNILIEKLEKLRTAL